MGDLLKALIAWWLVGIPVLAFATAMFILFVMIAGAPIWLAVWWLL
jgi:hypothetical protein